MALKEYAKKRSFDVTPEPKGSIKRSQRGSLLYVVQKHQASHLHYDFRLEWSGVLLSWAVPKGPSLDPKTKRLAMQVEDHPVEYGSFEGVIPEGEYGGGTVMLWDTGTWVPDDTDVDASLREGELKFTLYGKKLTGSWVLVRTRGIPPPHAKTARSGGPGGFARNARRSSWLLIKHRDEKASTADITVGKPKSVSSGRLLAEIAAEAGGNVSKARKGDPGKNSAARTTTAASRRAASRKPAVRRRRVS